MPIVSRVPNKVEILHGSDILKKSLFKMKLTNARFVFYEISKTISKCGVL